MSTIFALPQDILSEFSIDSQGKARASQRGTARLCGVSQPAIRKLLLKLTDNLDVPEIFKSYAGYSFKGDNLEDILVALIIEYYAFEAGRYCTKQAKLVFRAFATVGFRVWAQQQLGWQEKEPELSNDDIAFFANFAASSAEKAGVATPLIESIKLDSVMQIKPQAKPLLLPHKKAIASANPMPQKYLTPTEVGQELTKRLRLEKVSAQAINKKLIQLEYQVSIKRTKKSTGKIVHDYYKATEKGEPYSQLEMATYKVMNDGNSTKYQLRWLSGIIDLLANQW